MPIEELESQRPGRLSNTVYSELSWWGQFTVS
jgi:hypothetical protein